MPLSNKTHPYYKEKSSKAATIFAIYPCGEHYCPLCFPGSPGRTPAFLPWAGAWVCVWLYLLLWLSRCFSLFLLFLLNLFVAALIFSAAGIPSGPGTSIGVSPFIVSWASFYLIFLLSIILLPDKRPLPTPLFLLSFIYCPFISSAAPLKSYLPSHLFLSFWLLFSHSYFIAFPLFAFSL